MNSQGNSYYKYIIYKHQLKMSSKPARGANDNIHLQIVPLEWKGFIDSVVRRQKIRDQGFPRKEIMSFSQSIKCPKIKQLLVLLQMLYRKYQQDCEYFRQLIILLYLLILKGCMNTNEEVYSISLDLLQQLLKFRIIIICCSTESNTINQVYQYMHNWLGLLVPAIMINISANQRDRKAAKNQRYQKQESKQNKKKSLISIVLEINRKNKQKQSSIDQILIIFECMLICKIRSHLSMRSLFQFDNLMKRIYSSDKFSLIYQGRGCVSHLTNKQKQRMQTQKQLLASNLLSVSGLAPSRVNQSTWQLVQLQLQIPDNQESGVKRQGKNSIIRAKKVKSQKQVQKWVKQAYATQNKPNQIKLSLNTLINSMKAMQIYKFLSLLQIYGSSPSIQVLNQYINDESLLQLFTKFLLGENLVQFLEQLTKQNQNKLGRKIQNKNKEYSYKNQRIVIDNQVKSKVNNWQAQQYKKQKSKDLVIIQQIKQTGQKKLVEQPQ